MSARPKISSSILILLFCFTSARAQEFLDKIVAVINDKIILLSEVNQYTYQVAIQMGIDPRRDKEKFEQLRDNALQSLIDQKVLLTQAQLDSITVEDSQVDQVLEDRLKNMTQQLGSEEKVEAYFGQPLRKVRRMLRTEIADGLMIRNLQQKKFRQVTVSRREVVQFYEALKDSMPAIKATVKLSHILFNAQPGEEAVASARARIDSLLKRVRAGEDFAQVASQYSEDPGSSKRSGELGFIQRGDFVREFEEAAFALEPGEISGVVQSQFGFHIIQLIDRRGEKINVRHVLVRVPTTSEDKRRTREKLNELREQIVSGEITFEDAARTHSNDLATNEKGGDLDWFEVQDLQVPAFKEFSQTHQVGDISEPIEFQSGFHLVRLDNRRDSRQLDLTQDWKQIEEMALNQKSEREFRAWVDQLKKDMYIRVSDES